MRRLCRRRVARVVSKTMQKIYTPEHILFLEKNIKGRSFADLTKLFNRRFRLSVTCSSLKNFCHKNGFKSGFRPKIGWCWNKKYLPVHCRWLKKNVPGHHYSEILPAFNQRFGFSITDHNLASLCKRLGIQTGFSGCFQKGHVTHNKGKKGYCSPGSEKGWFRPGHSGYKKNVRAVGSERITVDGYVEVKVSDKPQVTQRLWRMKHVVIWEREHGPVPKGHVVVFLDKNKMNFALDNLYMVSRQVHSIMCHMNWYTENKKITSAYLATALNMNAVANLKRKSFDIVKNKKMVIISNTGSKYVIAEIIDKKGKKKYVAVRKTKNGLCRMYSKKIKQKATIEEAQRDLYDYALHRGWQRI